MGDYAWSEHIVTVFWACQITIKNVQVQLTVKGKTTPDSYTPTPISFSQHFLQQEAVQIIPWPAMSPDMNPIEHEWDFTGRKINQRNPKCKNGGLRVERAHCHGIFGLSDYHQERTSPTYSQRKNNPYIYTPTPNSSCAQNVVVLNEVFRWRQTLARPSVGRNKKRLSQANVHGRQR
jgi:hypothetical protein